MWPRSDKPIADQSFISHLKPEITRSDANGSQPCTGTLIINADDWGRDRQNTDRSLDCIQKQTISSVSAMVFMEDSERSADLAHERAVDCGLHLNLTAQFSGANVPSRLNNYHGRIIRFLRSNRLAPAVFHPGLVKCFEYVVRAQLDEFERLYDSRARRIDGHHHMHICSNVMRQKLLPSDTIIRRNFSFFRADKGPINRLYRRWQDRRLASRHRMSDYFFSLLPLYPRERLEMIFRLALRANVEIETHPVNDDEFRFLTGEALTRCLGELKVSQSYDLHAITKESTVTERRNLDYE